MIIDPRISSENDAANVNKYFKQTLLFVFFKEKDSKRGKEIILNSLPFLIFQSCNEYIRKGWWFNF